MKAINIKTAPYPGFATDLVTTDYPTLLRANGRGTIVDTIYEKRVNHVLNQQRWMDISTTNGHIWYTGGRDLCGASVKATDLRAGAALVIAGLMAEGKLKLQISSLSYVVILILLKKLRNLGADITLVED